MAPGKWSINKDEVVILKSLHSEKLLAAVWRQTQGDTLGVVAVVYGEYPDVWDKQKFFTGQVKEAKAWIENELK